MPPGACQGSDTQRSPVSWAQSPCPCSPHTEGLRALELLQKWLPGSKGL